MNYPDKLPVEHARSRQELARKVLDSARFRKAPKLRELLEYLAHRSEEEPVEIREQEIGCRVYGRAPGYDPSEDSIARVEIRNLRRRLDEYFQTEGQSESIVMTIPKGNYRISFLPRDISTAPQQSRQSIPSGRALRYAAIALLGAVLAGPLWIWVGRRSDPGSAVAAASIPRLPLWSNLFDGVRSTYIVVADSVWSEAQYIFQRNYSLAEYLSRRPFPEPVPHSWKGLEDDARHIFSRQYTSVADLQLACRIVQLPGVHKDKLFVRFARNMEMRDFKERNVILLGSSRANPWVELFEKDLNFRSEFDSKLRRPLFRNKAPRPGEQDVYAAGGSDRKSDEIYARAAYMPNLTKDGNILMIVGTLMEGTEAVGEFLTKASSLAAMVRDLGLEKDGQLQYFELLVKSSSVGGSPGATEIVAHRILER